MWYILWILRTIFRVWYILVSSVSKVRVSKTQVTSYTFCSLTVDIGCHELAYEVLMGICICQFMTWYLDICWTEGNKWVLAFEFGLFFFWDFWIFFERPCTVSFGFCQRKCSKISLLWLSGYLSEFPDFLPCYFSQTWPSGFLLILEKVISITFVLINGLILRLYEHLWASGNAPGKEYN